MYYIIYLYYIYIIFIFILYNLLYKKKVCVIILAEFDGEK